MLCVSVPLAHRIDASTRPVFWTADQQQGVKSSPSWANLRSYSFIKPDKLFTIHCMEEDKAAPAPVDVAEPPSDERIFAAVKELVSSSCSCLNRKDLFRKELK